MLCVMTFDSTLPMTNAKLLSFSFDFSINSLEKTTIMYMSSVDQSALDRVDTRTKFKLSI